MVSISSVYKILPDYYLTTDALKICGALLLSGPTDFHLVLLLVRITERHHFFALWWIR